VKDLCGALSKDTLILNESKKTLSSCCDALQFVEDRANVVTDAVNLIFLSLQKVIQRGMDSEGDTNTDHEWHRHKSH